MRRHASWNNKTAIALMPLLTSKLGRMFTLPLGALQWGCWSEVINSNTTIWHRTPQLRCWRWGEDYDKRLPSQNYYQRRTTHLQCQGAFCLKYWTQVTPWNYRHQNSSFCSTLNNYETLNKLFFISKWEYMVHMVVMRIICIMLKRVIASKVSYQFMNSKYE